MFQTILLSLFLVAPVHDDPVLQQPFADLIYSANSAEHSGTTSKSLRSSLAHERDDKIVAAKKMEKLWKEQLKKAREELGTLNKTTSTDSIATGNRRSQLHIDIAALERGIRDKSKEREHTIPAAYDAQFAKLWLLERWPDQRAGILHRIDEGHARD